MNEASEGKIMRVEPTMTVAELLEAEPRVARFFVEQHLHCLGCHMDVFCLLEHVATFYNRPTLLQELQAFVDALGRPEEGTSPPSSPDDVPT
ncbi:MAG: hypothetical protein Q9O62_12070 [Ardenticatenia bacterium]|nr:hypothetical protein [Ardenticatenia bacterium]